MKVKELEAQGKYVYRYKPLVFRGHGPETPQREGDVLDSFDRVFESKQDFDKWYKETVIEYAQLDEYMNYCKYFVREKGNDGHYVREGKSFPISGTYCGTLDYNPEFKQFCKENGWENNWFELMDRYK